MKNHGTTILHYVLIVGILFLLAGCGSSKPEEVVRSELDLVKQLDESTIDNLISYEDMVHSHSDTIDSGNNATEAILMFFKNFDYTIKSSTATNKTATVTAEITNIDAGALAKDLCLELIRQSIEADSDTASLSTTDSYFTLLRDILTEHEYELVTTEATFELSNTDGKWIIENNSTLENELVGGFITYLNDPYLVTPEEILTLALNTFEDNTANDWISYLSMNDIFSTYSDLSGEVDFALATQIADCFAYELGATTIDGDSASSVLKITSFDMTDVLDQYLTKLMAYTTTTEAVRASDTELANKTAELLIEVLDNNNKTVTTTLEIPFINNGSTWEMQLNEEFTDALLGGMTKAVEAFQTKANQVSQAK